MKRPREWREFETVKNDLSSMPFLFLALAEVYRKTAANNHGITGLLTTDNGDKTEQKESKTICDNAYTHLKDLVDEVSEAGKYLFCRIQGILTLSSQTHESFPELSHQNHGCDKH